MLAQIGNQADRRVYVYTMFVFSSSVIGAKLVGVSASSMSSSCFVTSAMRCKGYSGPRSSSCLKCLKIKKFFQSKNSDATKHLKSSSLKIFECVYPFIDTKQVGNLKNYLVETYKISTRYLPFFVNSIFDLY